MLPFIVVLGTQENIKMNFSNHIIRIATQKVNG